MSYPAEDRHERDRDSLVVSASSSRNTGQEKEKIEKNKVVGAPAGAHVSDSPSYTGRQITDLTSHKTGKPIQSRPIAPAASSQGPMALHSSMIQSGIMQLFGPQQFGPNPQLLRNPAQHPFASHVPPGAAAAAAAAMAAPRGSAMMRASGIPPSAKSVSAPSQHPQSQVTSVTSHAQSSSGATTTATCLVTSVPTLSAPATGSHSTQSQHGDHRTSDSRESRPEVRQIIPDVSRRTASPHILAQPHSSSGVNQQSVNPGAKIGLAISAAPSQSSSMHKSGPPVIPSTHPPSVHPAAAVSSIATSSLAISTIGTMPLSGHPQPKILSTTAVSGTAAILSNMTKMYPQHSLAAFQAARPPLSNTDANVCVDQSRLGKPSGAVSSSTVSAPHNPTPPASHPPLSTQSSVAGTDSARIDRPRQAIPLAGQFPYPMPPAYFFQTEPISGYPLQPYYSPGFGANPSLVRPPTGAAQAAQAAQVAAAASQMGQIHMMDPRFISQLAAQAGAVGIGAQNVSSHSTDSGGVTTMADGVTGNASGIYGFPGAMLGMASSANLQSQMAAANPNSTSPRPSILRKRTSEGMRKMTTQPPFNESVNTSQTEPEASPRSDTTVSTPHSARSSPKPPSDTGNQGNEQQTASVAPCSQATIDQPASTQLRPTSPSKVKKEPPEVPVTTIASTTAVINKVTQPVSTTVNQIPSSPAVATADVTASPRKKPRKQNVIPTEDKYGSTVPVEANQSGEEEERKPKPEDVSDEDLKFILLKRPKISIYGGYRVNTRAAHNHFVRYSDVRVKEERKPTIQDFACQKGILQRANGWRVQHSAAQLDELNSVEQDVLRKMGELREKLPKPKPGQKAKYQDELAMLHELVQGNIQRSQLVVEQLTDTRKSMVKILEHRRRAVEMLQKQMNKRNPKKKS